MKLAVSSLAMLGGVALWITISGAFSKNAFSQEPALIEPPTESTLPPIGTPEGAYLVRTSAAPDLPTPFATGSLNQFTILIPRQALDLRVGSKTNLGVRTLAEHLRSLTVFADGTECATISLTVLSSSGEGKVISLGTPFQSEACRREGARIQIVDGFGRELATEFTLKQGGTVQLVNLAPKPPHTGGEWGTNMRGQTLMKHDLWTGETVLMLIAGASVGLATGFVVMTVRQRPLES